MILTVTLNAALDITHQVDRLSPNTSHRVAAAHVRAGGKGINVSRVLAALDVPTVITGLVGGPTGQQVRTDLQSAGLQDQLLKVAGQTRRTLTVVSQEDGDATVFNEAGLTVTPAVWSAFTAHYVRLVRHARLVVLSGSLPPGAPVDAYAQLIRLAAAAGVRTVLDASGDALRRALGAGPEVVKPNSAELAATTGHEDPAVAAAILRALGARSVVASQGPDGLYARTPHGGWRALPPEQLAGNPTGAGDACVAALAAGLAAGTPWPDLLREAVALSAAAVLSPVAGDFDREAYHRFRTAAVVDRLDDAPARQG